jgi:hypothetical protein
VLGAIAFNALESLPSRHHHSIRLRQRSPSPIPHLHPLLENCVMFRVRHRLISSQESPHTSVVYGVPGYYSPYAWTTPSIHALGRNSPYVLRCLQVHRQIRL